jgi:cytochrome c
MRHTVGKRWQHAPALLWLCLLLVCLPCTAEDAAPHYGIGTPASADDIAAWDIDVRPDGQGLPPGQGTPAEGETLYRELCEHCHGEAGSGGPFGALVGRLPGDAFPFGRDPTVKKTVGNYWPYATTLFDYIRRSMPFESPGSLDANAVYSLVAYLLRENRVIAPGKQLDQDNLADIRMPARDRFVPNDRRGGEVVR